MQLRGKVELNTVELPDALEITVSRDDGAIESIAFPIFAFVVLAWFWVIGRTWWPRILASIAAISTVAGYISNWIQGGKTTLRVTRDELLAEGNLGRLFSTHEKIPVSNVASIGYDSGGDGGISGLYVRDGWRSTSLLPNLSPEQVNAVIETIHQKFPNIPIQPYSPFTISDLGIFSSGDQMTTLGLSNRGRDDGDPQS